MNSKTNNRRRKPVAVMAGIMALSVLAAGKTAAAPIELVVNGGFEAGLVGWMFGSQATGDPNGFATIGAGITAPLSGTATVGPFAGLQYAISDQGGPGAHFLTQTVNIPVGVTSATLSFQMFVNDQSGVGPIIDPTGLDFTTGGTNNPNQHGRVDLMVGGTGVGLGLGGVLANLFIGNDPAATNPNPYTFYSFNILPIVAGGGALDIRFAEVDNQFFFNMGIDNVSLIVDTADVPEPSTLALLSLSLAGLAFTRRKKKLH